MKHNLATLQPWNPSNHWNKDDKARQRVRQGVKKLDKRRGLEDVERKKCVFWGLPPAAGKKIAGFEKAVVFLKYAVQNKKKFGVVHLIGANAVICAVF